MCDLTDHEFLDTVMTKHSDATRLFENFFTHFRTTPLWRAMVNTREDSPWHREANVGVHTQMLLAWYMTNFASKRSDKQQMLTLMACLFHDVGKPKAEIVKFSEERGEYRAYHGHEQMSARIWEEHALENWDAVKNLTRLDLNDMSNIAFMVEHHVPFALKNPRKRSELKQTLLHRGGEPLHRAYLDLLLCDQHGRISDGQAEKLAAVEQWMIDWENV